MNNELFKAMSRKDIKVGEDYYVRVKVTAISENRFVCRPLLWGSTMSDFAPNYFNFAEAEAFYMSIDGGESFIGVLDKNDNLVKKFFYNPNDDVNYGDVAELYCDRLNTEYRKEQG